MRRIIKSPPVNLDCAFTRHAHPDIRGFRMIEYASVSRVCASGDFVHHRWVTIPEDRWNEDGVSEALNRATYIKETLGELCGLIEHEELFQEVYKVVKPEDMGAKFIQSFSSSHRWG